MNKQPWTMGEVRRVDQLRKEGKTAAEIGSVLGRSASSVEGLVKRQQLVDKMPRMERILPFVQKPHSLAVVAELFALSIRTISTFKRRLRALGYRVYRSSSPGRRPLRQML